ncbi:MAG: three-Cys-motif partner protein TcmP [Thermodesulfovibrionales bacterium]|nr:three-Cys-motif partner protein TcmP [Thermodesulfovibrionales bacterium]
MKLDQVGIWSEIKLEIIKEYASAYTKIMSSQSWCKGYVYIDAFAGAGKHISKQSGEMIQGSPLNALEVEPPFTEYHFIDLDEERADVFRRMAKKNPNVHAYHGDCNEILKTKIFPALTYNSRKRALCILDPYGLHLKWETIKAAAELKTIDIFINFSIQDANRNVLFEDLARAKPEDIERMNAFWGDESWKELLYREQETFFGETRQVRIEDYQILSKEFCMRLKRVGFNDAPEPILMRNKKGGPLYYLCFASQKNVAKNIVNDIFDKYRRAY